MKKILLCVSAAVLLLTSCDPEDEEPTNITPTVGNLTGSYKITGATANSQDVFMTAYAACERDDVYTLGSYSSPATTGTYTLTDAGTQCNPTTSDTGTWSLISSTTIDLNGLTYTITSFNGTNLVVSFSFGGTTYTETYTKQ